MLKCFFAHLPLQYVCNYFLNDLSAAKRVFVLAWLGVYMKLFSKNHSLRAVYVFRLALIMSRLSCGLGEAFFRNSS